MYGLSQARAAKRRRVSQQRLDFVDSETERVSPFVSSLKKVLDGIPIVGLRTFFHPLGILAGKAPGVLPEDELADIGSGAVAVAAGAADVWAKRSMRRFCTRFCGQCRYRR